MTHCSLKQKWRKQLGGRGWNLCSCCRRSMRVAGVGSSRGTPRPGQLAWGSPSAPVGFLGTGGRLQRPMAIGKALSKCPTSSSRAQVTDGQMHKLG